MATLLIDGSNLARSVELDPIGIPFSWQRVENFVSKESLQRISKLIGVVIDDYLLFVEESCKRDSGYDDKSRFASEPTIFKKYVDPELLDLWAESPNERYFIASKDRFFAFRREFPELNNCEVIKWGNSPVWDVNCIMKRRLTHEDGELLTKAILLDLFEACGRNDSLLKRFAVANRFEHSCPQGCTSYSAHHTDLPPWNSQIGSFVCVVCGQPLTKGDLLPESAMVVVDRGAMESVRFRALDGYHYRIGREPSSNLAENVVGVQIDNPDRFLSREAIIVEYDAAQGLRVRNDRQIGLTITNRKKNSTRELKAGQSTPLYRGERVGIGGGFTVRLSTNPYAGQLN